MLFKTIENTIKKYNLIKPNDKIILAVSGGPDSVLLTKFFADNKKKYNLNLHILHINHLIRKNKVKAETEFVKSLAEKCSIPFYYYKEDAPKYAKENQVSLEEAARNIRLKIYDELIEKLRADKIATGHNMDDQAETVLMRIIRGAGAEGLIGIRPASGYFIRPLIELRKNDIVNYLNKNKVKFTVDESNKDIKFFRNKIRHNLIPLLEAEYNPNIKESLIKLSYLANEDESFLQNLVKEKLKGAISKTKDALSIKLNKIIKNHPALIKRMIKHAVKLCLGHAEDFTNYHYEKIYNLIKEQKGHKKLSLPNNLAAEKIYDKLIINRVLNRTAYGVQRRAYSVGTGRDLSLQKIKPEEFSAPGDYKFDNWGISLKSAFIKKITQKLPYIAYFDFNKIKNNKLILRARRDGDYFIPLGMKGRKKLQDFFTDIKVPKEERDRVPLITAGDDIIWVVGYRISEKYKVTPETKRILKIESWRIDAS